MGVRPQRRPQDIRLPQRSTSVWLHTLSGWLRWSPNLITLHSGSKSHWFVDGAAMFNDEHIRESVLDYWQEKLGDRKVRLVAIPTGGIVWAEALAERTGNAWGTPDRLPAGQEPIVVIDDVVTTGASLRVVPYKFALVVVVRNRYVHVPRVITWASIKL